MKDLKNNIMMLIAALMIIAGCSKSEGEIDTTYPSIDITAEAAFPKQCSIIERGSKFTFNASFSDDLELGAVSIDIHHNFDHHSHSTEVSNCDMDPIKSAVKPFLFIQDYTIPGGINNHTMKQEISVPADIDPGDYHFLIRVTDKAGWQTIKGISIKIR
jgi:hypothetical protein